MELTVGQKIVPETLRRMVITLRFGNLEFSSGCLGSFFDLFPVHIGKTNMAPTNR